MDSLKILALSGSLRTGSYNRKLLQIAKKIAQEEGAQVQEIDLRELALPPYDGDIETQGAPESVKKWKNAIEACDILLICTPEYNWSVPGVLKNAIDWASRLGNSFSGKTAAIMGASNGKLGTVRAQLHLRQIFQTLGVMLLPSPQILVSYNEEAFTDAGELKDPKTYELMQKLIRDTMSFTRTLQSSSSHNA